MDHIAADLAKKSYSVLPNGFPAPFIAKVRADLLNIHESKQFTRAAIGKERLLKDEIRRDEIFWLNSESANSVQTELLGRMHELMVFLNRRCLLGLRSFEGHYAFYPTGGFYAKHLDKFKALSDREVSVVLYLNETWDGGQLRLHTKDGPVDVDPAAGTLVCFLSGEIEHEVLESHAPRLSFTGWFKT